MDTLDDYLNATPEQQRTARKNLGWSLPPLGPDALRYYARELDDNTADPHPEMKRDA